MNNYLRPDEKANQSEIKKAKGRSQELRSGLTHLASAGTTALGGVAASKVLPFLNQYIPEELALKGIKKVAPAIGRYIDHGMEQGLSLKSGLDFIKGEFERKRESQEKPEEEEKRSKAKDDRNIIQQYDPVLFSILKSLISKGASPKEAALKARDYDKGSKKIIEQIEKDHKTPFSNIVEEIFGMGQPNQNADDPLNPPHSQPSGPQSAESQAFSGQGQQSQGLDPAVAQLLQQGQQILSKFRGNRG